MDESTIALDDLIDGDEVRILLGRKERPMPAGTLAAMLSRQQIPHIRLSGRVVRFSRRELTAWLEERRVPVVGGPPRPASRKRKPS